MRKQNITRVCVLALIVSLLPQWLAPAIGETPQAATATQPNNAVIPVPKLENDSYDWYARHDAILQLQKQIKPEVVMIGDSITHFWAGEPKSKRQSGPNAWKDLFGDRPVLNMGFGWDRTQNVLWRLDHGEFDGLAPKYVVIHIGTNNFSGTKNARANTPAEVFEGIKAICDRVHAKSPQSKIILMSVFPRGQKPTDPYRAKIAALNEKLPALASDWLKIVDIGPKFLGADGTISREVMGDYLHPNEKGYAIWAEALKPAMKE